MYFPYLSDKYVRKEKKEQPKDSCANWRILKRGDILELRKLGYSHYAVVVDCGSDEVNVVHVQGADRRNAKKSAQIVEETLAKFSQHFHAGLYHRANEFDDSCEPYPADMIVRRARSKIGLWNYSLYGNNCEHFSNWCRYGIDFSSQSRGDGEKDNFKTRGLGGSLTMGPVRAGVSLHATTGIRSQNDKDGYRKAFVAEAKYAQADVGRVRATVGLSATTGVNASDDGVGVQVLGTGIQIGRETKISFFGSTFGVRWY